jgi:drug/metabolite transporter (DMT)-like permease
MRGTVFVWGTTWIALRYQVGEVDPQVSLLWRFLLAAPVLFAICRLAGHPLRFPPAMHLRFAALGLFLFSTNFNLFYHAGAFVVSGLLAVIFSLSSITNILLGALILREPLRLRVVLGAVVGLAGVATLFSPEMGGGFDRSATAGLTLGVLGCLSFSVGNMISARLGRSGVPVLSATSWGVAYGVLINFAIAILAGSAFAIEATPRYLLSLLWLGLPGSVLAFWMYLALLSRIGADRAAYTTVLSPVLALLVSTFAEDYRWSAAALAGLALVALGNVLVLRRGRSERSTPGPNPA